MSGGWPYSYAILNVDLLTVDESYQRPLTTFARRIEHGFDPALVGTLVVSRRADGTLAVVDGQTRAAAISHLVAAGEIASPGVPCLVYEGLSRADEASLFARLQKERRGISSYHRFRAAVVAGEEEAVAIQAIVRAAGHDTGVGKDKIGAVAALERVYRFNPTLLERTFAVLADAYGAEYVPAADMLRGVGRLLHDHGDIDARQLADRLRPLSLARLKRISLEVAEERGGGAGNSAEACMAEAMEAVYNGYSPDAPRTPVEQCEAPRCAAWAQRGSRYCDDHAAMAAELRRRHLSAVA